MARPTPTTNPNDKDERYRRVWDVVSGIPSGCVLNYGEIARLAGLPGRARLVGRALGLAPRSMQLPWHRVVNAQGRISFKPGGAQYRRQRELLEGEGVEFDGEIIDLERHAPAAALDRMLWGP
jgi:methylated-DNA-protein-cysteine methyltransferase-like protein